MLKTVLGVVRNARENAWIVPTTPSPLVKFTVHLGTEDSQEVTKAQLDQAGNREPRYQGPTFNSAPSQLCDLGKIMSLSGLQYFLTQHGEVTCVRVCLSRDRTLILRILVFLR